VLGETPKTGTLAVLAAQWAHETGRGTHMFNYNFGGIKAAGSPAQSVALPTHEGSGTERRAQVAGFRAYASAEDGAVDYVRLLSTRYPEAIHAARASDPAGFVQALKAGGYFTDNLQAYQRSVSALATQALDGGFGALSTQGLQSSSSPSALAPYSPPTLALSGALPSDVPATFLDALDQMQRAALSIAATDEERS
jgi:hypothetical protein